MTPYYSDDAVTIYHGDAREVGSTVGYDAVVTDPPYGIGVNAWGLGRRKSLHDRTAKWDNAPADVGWLLDDRPAVIWGGNHFPLPPSTRWLVWDKETGRNSFADCELAWTNLTGPVRKIVVPWLGARARDPEDPTRYHPTQKPTAVMRWSLGFVSGLVVDPYMGSGTTLVAARQIGRKAIGIEIEERYCEIAANRCRQEVLGLTG